MMGQMRKLDPHDELQEGWEPAQKPPPGPGFDAHAAPEPPLIPPRPSLCHAGCLNYHRLVTHADAEEPQAVELLVTLPRESRFARPGANGRTIVRSLPVLYTEVQHYCYPSLGIEMKLGSEPVLECNRFKGGYRYGPKYPADYLQAVKEWEESYARLKAEGDEFDAMLNDALYGRETL